MIYLDNAATTKPCKAATDAQNYANEFFFNSSALYAPAIKAESQIGQVRQRILQTLNLNASHGVIFTSGATEANNMALFQATRFKGKTILIGGGEHSSVYNYVKEWLGTNFKIDFKEIALAKNGEVDIDDLRAKLSPQVCMVSIMQVSNETGAISDITKAAEIVKAFDSKILFHCDAVQGFCKVLSRLPKLADLITISSHKIGGLKGTGALVYNSALNLKPLIHGGGQEFNLRSGTQNVGGILAFGAAIDSAANIEANFKKAEALNEYARKILAQKCSSSGIRFNGQGGSPFIINISFPHVRSEIIVRLLEEQNIIVSNGSACSSRHADNRVLAAMGVPKKYIEGTIRISFCSENTKKEIDILATALCKILKELNK